MWNPRMISSMPDGYIPRLESKEWECWKLLDWHSFTIPGNDLHNLELFFAYSFTGST